MQWSYGVTTVPQRLGDLLPSTLRSLRAAGFDDPRLFIDGCVETLPIHLAEYEITERRPRVRVAGNWWLSMVEVYLRGLQVGAQRFAIFQDDFITYPHLKEYLDQCKYPDRGYWNLYTVPMNQDLARQPGWFESNQRGLGAVALVFDRKAVQTLLAAPHFVNRPQDLRNGHKKVDGGIVTAMTKAGYKEYVHNPSLVEHLGLPSTIEGKHSSGAFQRAASFRGQTFDAREMMDV